MSTATIHHTTPTRRNALKFSASAILAGLTTPVLAVALAPDDELLRLCAAFHRQHEIVETVPVVDDSDFNELGAAVDLRWDISEQIEDITPVTAAGQKAKAGVALLLLEENYGPDGSNEGSAMRFAVAALRDIAGSVRA